MFRLLRLILLISLLVFVALKTWTDNVYPKRWRAPIQVALYPINADGSAKADHTIQNLSAADFESISAFMSAEAKRHGLPLDQPFAFTLAAPLRTLPPRIDDHPSTFQVMWWSLKMRWYAWRAPTPPGPTVIVNMFLLYHDPDKASVLPDSTGLQKGRLGIAHLFAVDHLGSNAVVIAHELLHTLGATDKYDLGNSLPRYPEGFVAPDQQPLYPQPRAELMAARIPVAPDHAAQPESLKQVEIGELTAQEINWIKAP